MNYFEAQIILDRCRNGEPVTVSQINQALELTGDLDHVPCSLADAVEAA